MPSGQPPLLTVLQNSSDPAERERAWAGFVAEHTGLILFAIRRHGGGSRDAVMDRYAFVLEQLKLDDFRRLRAWVNDGRSQFGTWLVVVVGRLCHDHHRARYGRSPTSNPERNAVHERRRRLADLVAEELNPELTQEGGDGEAPDPGIMLRRAELQETLARAVAAIETTDQMLLTLRFRDGRSAPEIARIMAFPTPFHVYRRLNHLLDVLRRDLRSRGVEDSAP
jgi:RNA polymerase sigma factor (sigma-70 family)